MQTSEILENFWNTEALKGVNGVISGNIELSTMSTANLLSRSFDFNNKKILDAGCGIGRLTGVFTMDTSPIEVVGTDWSEKMLDQAKNFHPTVTFKLAPHWAIPYEDNYFDFTACITSLCHVMEDKFDVSLAELARVTNKDLVIIDGLSCAEKKFYPHSYMWTRRLEDYIVPGFTLKFHQEYCLGRLDHCDSNRTLMYFIKN